MSRENIIGNASEESSTEHGDFRTVLSELRSFLGETEQKTYDVGFATVSIHDVGDMVNVTISTKEDMVERKVVFRVWSDKCKTAGIENVTDTSHGYRSKRGEDITPIFSVHDVASMLRDLS